MFKVGGKEKTRGVPSTPPNRLLLRKEESAVKPIFYHYIHLKARYVLTVKLSRNHSISKNCSDFIHQVGSLGVCLFRGKGQDVKVPSTSETPQVLNKRQASPIVVTFTMIMARNEEHDLIHPHGNPRYPKNGAEGHDLTLNLGTREPC